MYFETKNTQYPIATKEATFPIIIFPRFTSLLTHCPGVPAPTLKGKGGDSTGVKQLLHLQMSIEHPLGARLGDGNKKN